MTPQDPLRDAVDDLHRWDVSRGWPAFNVILARIDAALPAATEPADGLRLDAMARDLADVVRRAPDAFCDLSGARHSDLVERRVILAALRAEPVPGDGG